MGGKIGKIILPLVAIAATVATGPAGAGLWGAAAAPAAAGGTAGGLLGLAPVTTAALAPAGMDAIAGASFLSEASALASPLASLAGAGAGLAAAAPAVIAPVAEQGFFSSLVSGFSDLTGMQKIGLGMQAVSGVGNIVSGNINAAGQDAAIAFQENQQKLQQSRDRLDIANKELDSQRRLRSTLATQNNYFAALGIDPAQGSAANLADAARGAQGIEQGILNSRRAISGAASRNRLAALRSRRRRGGGGIALGSLLDFGGSFAGAIDRNRRLGRAARPKRR